MGLTSTLGCGCCGRVGSEGGGDGTATVVRTAEDEKSGAVNPLLPLLVVVTIAPAGLTVTLFCAAGGGNGIQCDFVSQGNKTTFV